MNWMRWVRLVAVMVALGLLAAACAAEPPERGGGQGGEAIVVEVHRSPLCECCGEYEGYLERSGFRVVAVDREDLADLKRELGIPEEMSSCHTAMVEGYFVEGHVPVEVIRDLLAERPEVDGITLPGMPPGSPGMGGVKTEPWVIWAVDDGRTEVYARV